MIIRAEDEYREAARRVGEQRERLAAQRAKLEGVGLGPQDVKELMDPVQTFHRQAAEEVEAYERLKRGEFGEVRNLRGVGQLLIAARIARGLSQRELAQRLGVNESQVSRDERNEYHGVTLERASRILEALGVEARTTVAVLGRREAVPA